jgi:hypothetical protein
MCYFEASDSKASFGELHELGLDMSIVSTQKQVMSKKLENIDI